MLSYAQFYLQCEASSRRGFINMLSGAVAGVASLGIPSLVKPTVGISGRCGVCRKMSTSLRGGMRVIVFPMATDTLLICSECWSYWGKYWAQLADERNSRIAQKKHDEGTRRDSDNRERGKRLAASLPLKTWAQRKLPHTFTSNDRGEYDYDDVVRGVSEASSRRDFLKMLSGAAAGVAGATALGEVPADPASDDSSSFWFRTCGMCGEYSNSPLKRGMRAVNLDPKTYRAGRGYLRGTPAFGMEPTIGRFSDNVGICSRCWSLMDKYWRNRSRLRKKLDIPTGIGRLALKTPAMLKQPYRYDPDVSDEHREDDIVRDIGEAVKQ